MKQNNQTSWAARLRKLSALCLALVATANVWAADKLTIKPSISGQTGTIAISLDNETPYTAFQMEITLPAGLSIAKEGAMSIDADRANLHQVSYNQLESGVIRVAAFSFDGTNGNEAFSGTSGDLLIINVTVADSYKAAEVQVENILFVKKSDLTAVNNVTAGYQVGDVDYDGSVTVLDGLAIIDYYLKKNPTPFNAAAADLDGNGKVEVLDALAAIDIYLKK